MKFTFPSVSAFIAVSFAALVAWSFSHWTGLSFWTGFAIAVVAMFINGVIAEVEDNAPNGFNNPLPPTEFKPPAPTRDDTDRTG
jgi:hypothetical protein